MVMLGEAKHFQDSAKLLLSNDHPDLAELGHPLKLCCLQKKTKSRKKLIFALYGSWEALDGCKILLQVMGTICPPGKPHSEKNKFQLCFWCPNSARGFLNQSYFRHTFRLFSWISSMCVDFHIKLIHFTWILVQNDPESVQNTFYGPYGPFLTRRKVMVRLGVIFLEQFLKVLRENEVSFQIRVTILL